MSATTTSIPTAVPAGASTGLVHMTTPSGAADSPSAFTVLTAMTITPAYVGLLPTRTLQFTASGPATWTVNGVPGGTATAGTISPTGLYTAPGTSPSPRR